MVTIALDIDKCAHQRTSRVWATGNGAFSERWKQWKKEPLLDCDGNKYENIHFSMLCCDSTVHTKAKWEKKKKMNGEEDEKEEEESFSLKWTDIFVWNNAWHKIVCIFAKTIYDALVAILLLFHWFMFLSSKLIHLTALQ